MLSASGPRACRRAPAVRRLRVRASAAVSSAPPRSPLAAASDALRRRLAADPSFGFKLAAEAITLSANLALRGANPLLWPLESALQAVAQLIVAGLNDVALVWCLAPVVRDPADEEAEAAGERLPAHVFESGDYTLGQRGQAFAAKAQLYAVIGAFTGLLSTVLTAVLSREASLFGAAVWARATLVGALHLGISANVRYQLVNGVEVVLYSRLPTAAARSASVALRFANNVSGTFLWIALSAAVRAVWVI